MLHAASNSAIVVEATVSSKGQVTLPSALRKRLGLQKGSRIRFSMPEKGDVRMEPVRHDIEDVWKMVDAVGRAAGVMSFDEMNAAKALRQG